MTGFSCAFALKEGIATHSRMSSVAMKALSVLFVIMRPFILLLGFVCQVFDTSNLLDEPESK